MRLTWRLFSLLFAAVLLPIVSVATEPSGVVSNVILGQGTPVKEIDEHVSRGDMWMVKLQSKGQSDFFYQDLVVAPGGRTGWHHHPGLLMITVKEGTVDFYDARCTKQIFTAGQAFMEGSEPHNALNTGAVSARLLVFYITKKGEPRRLESSQPSCAVSLSIL